MVRCRESACANVAMPGIRYHAPQDMKYTVLIVEDEASVAKEQVYGLEEEGFDVCRQLRAESCTMPVIMVTAMDAEVDRILGLESGGGKLPEKSVLSSRNPSKKSEQLSSTISSMSSGNIVPSTSASQLVRQKHHHCRSHQHFRQLRQILSRRGIVKS